MSKFGWCVTGHHDTCWRTVGGDHPHYPEMTCGCECHIEDAQEDE